MSKRFLVSMFYKFFDKKTSGSGITSEIKQNELGYRTIWGFNLPDLQLISIFNKEIRFLLSVVDTFSKDVWIIPLKDKIGTFTTIFKTNFTAFQSILNDSKKKA